MSIAARFTGTQVSVRLADGTKQNEFAVIVDGNTQSNIVAQSGDKSYVVATGLSSGTHDVLLWRRTEAYYDPTEFLGFTSFGTGGTLLAPPAAPDRRIEIIGDSLTCGYGNEGSPGCSGTKPENNFLAYGSVAARALGADLVTIAWSGIGMYRNYGTTDASPDAMPFRYDLAIPTDSTSTWDFSKYRPHVVVINLGTNDFSKYGDPGQPFVTAYTNFVKHVRSKYADVPILCIIPLTESQTAINEAITAVRNAGDTKVEAIDLGSWSGTGCDGHPSVALHKTLGDKLVVEIKRVAGW